MQTFGASCHRQLKCLVNVFGLSGLTHRTFVELSGSRFLCVWQGSEQRAKLVIYGCAYLCSCNTIHPSFLPPSLQSTYERSGSCGWGRAPGILSATRRRPVNWTPATASSCSTAWSFASGRSVWPVSVYIHLLHSPVC